MANAARSPQNIDRHAKLADEAIEDMFGYYSREPQEKPRPANALRRHFVVSELDATRPA